MRDAAHCQQREEGAQSRIAGASAGAAGPGEPALRTPMSGIACWCARRKRQSDDSAAEDQEIAPVQPFTSSWAISPTKLLCCPSTGK
jgi:hypothetical protein